MKECHKCGEEKPLDGFYKAKAKDGRDNTCKECRKARVRQNRREKIEQYREYERQRAMLPHRVAMRERYQQTPEGKAAARRARERYKNSERGKEAARLYLESDAGKASRRRSTVRYRESHPIKVQAHARVNKAVMRGQIAKPDACEECGKHNAIIHAHHDDYLRQLDVRWLCPACHKAWHDEHGEAANADHEPLPQFHMKDRRRHAEDVQVR